MAFDLENAVQQGFNRDVTTNDWNVEAKSLEIKLGDHGGVEEFRVLDDENVAVVVADSDGYLSIAGNAEVHGGHILVRGESLVNTEFLTLQTEADEISVHVFNLNPDGTVTGEKGSFGTNMEDGYMYVNVDGSTQWERLARVSQIPNIESLTGLTLQGAYDNDDDQGQNDGANILTTPALGSVMISGPESLWVRADGGINLDGPFDMDGYAGNNFTVDLPSGSFSFDVTAASNLTVDGADLTVSTTTAGDVKVVIPDGTGDFTVDDAGGARYLRAISSNGELQLGDPDVFITVMDDLRVVGDLLVQGTTTTVSTQELLVEDRLIRLNAGSPDSSFSGNVGIEAEVGSDGYVEFHWDDTAGRWELSIDRNTTPEAQTFRPLAYLADAPNTLDLSDTGNDNYPTDGPNPSGASVINSNANNFPQTFGPDMSDDSVQAALEAIDGYFKDDVTAAIVNIDETHAPLVHSHTHASTTGQTANDHHNELHTIASHSDTSATGAELDELTDGSTTTLHNHAAATPTLQDVYDNDVDGGGATITTNSTDGPVVIAGTQSLTVSGAGGLNLDGLFDMDSTGDFNVKVTGAGIIDMESGTAFELDAYADSHVTVDSGELVLATTTSGSVHIDGAGGISLDGNGSDVLPAVSCQDGLGDASHGWVDIYLCNGADKPVPLGGAGESGVGPGGGGSPNQESGAYVVGTNSENFVTFGPDMSSDTVQSALEAIDGYLTDIMSGDIEFDPFTQEVGLDINGCVLNGVGKIWTNAGTPGLVFPQGGTSRASWSIPVPADWDGSSDIIVKIIWAPSDGGAGNVEWRLEYKSLSLTELASAASTNVDYTQAAAGTTDEMQSTGFELAIPGSAIAATDEVMVINAVRRGSAAGDTYAGKAHVHLVKYSYIAQNIVSP